MPSVLIGKIVNVHGIKGEVKVYPYTDDINHLAKNLKKIYLDENMSSQELNVSCRIQKDMLLMKISGIDRVEDATPLKGKNIYVDEDSLDTLEDNTYYIKDIIGIDVIDEKENKIIGKVTYVFNTGANDVYEVETPSKKIYLPAISEVIKKVDIKNKKMYVEIMKGLI